MIPLIRDDVFATGLFLSCFLVVSVLLLCRAAAVTAGHADSGSEKLPSRSVRQVASLNHQGDSRASITEETAAQALIVFYNSF